MSVWPENWPVLELFLCVCSQWRSGPMGGALGLDYAAVDVVIRRRALEVTPEQFQGLQIMERAVQQEWGRQRERRERFPGKR